MFNPRNYFNRPRYPLIHPELMRYYSPHLIELFCICLEREAERLSHYETGEFPFKFIEQWINRYFPKLTGGPAFSQECLNTIQKYYSDQMTTFRTNRIAIQNIRERKDYESHHPNCDPDGHRYLKECPAIDRILNRGNNRIKLNRKFNIWI